MLNQICILLLLDYANGYVKPNKLVSYSVACSCNSSTPSTYISDKAIFYVQLNDTGLTFDVDDDGTTQHQTLTCNVTSINTFCLRSKLWEDLKQAKNQSKIICGDNCNTFNF